MKNLGKKFEQNFRKSIPESRYIYYYRLKDSASSYYGGNVNLRFSQNNIADAFLFHIGEQYNRLLILEFKSHKGKSLPLDCIRENQYKEMLEASEKLAVIPLFIVFFSDIERCFALSIENFDKFVQKKERKSIPLEYFEKNGIEIEVIKKRTNYNYNIEEFLKEL